MIKRNIPYGLEPFQQMDIHFPSYFATHTPVVFLIHGGGFIAGTKEDFEDQAVLFQKQGFISVNLSHRLIDSYGLINVPPTHRPSSVTIQNQVEDVKAAVDTFTKLAESWGAGASRLFMAGHSAGAVLSMLYVQGEWNLDTHIIASANWAGLTNLSLPPDDIISRIDKRWKELLYRATGAEPSAANIAKYEVVSPHWVTALYGGKPHISVFPENNLIFGLPLEKELQQGYTQDYHQLLRKKGVPERLVILKNENHGFRMYSGSWERVIMETAGFFKSLID